MLLLSASLGITKDFLPKIAERITPDDVYNYRDDVTTFQDFARINGVNADTDEIGLTMLLNNKLQPENKAAADNVEKLLDDMGRRMTEKMNSLF